MKKYLNNKIILNFIILNLIPLILTFLHFHLDLGGIYGSLNNFLFTYNQINSFVLGKFFITENFQLLYMLILFIYNFILLILISNVIKKYLTIFITVFSVISGFIGLIFLGVQMSV